MKRINICNILNWIRAHSTTTKSSREEAIRLALKNQKWKQGISFPLFSFFHHHYHLTIILLLAFILSHQGTYENRVFLYHYLHQQQLYIEAKMVYDTFHLKKYSSLALNDVKDDDLNRQRQSLKSTHLYFPLSKDKIIIVDSIEKIEVASNIINCNSENIIGIDVEWKPVFRYTPLSTASLLQVATKGNVLIFDLLKLLGNCNNDNTKLKDHSIDLITSIFSKSSLLKLGFGFANEDIKMLKAVGLKIEDIKNLVDIQTMKFNKSTHNSKNIRSLSGICQSVLRKPIYKLFQISDWSIRPLDDDQIQYAALDSHVLLGLYDTENEQLNLKVSELYLSQSI